MPAKGPGLKYSSSCSPLPLADRPRNSSWNPGAAHNASPGTARRRHVMQRSVYLAKLIGPICLVIGIGMLINGAVYRTIIGEFLHSYALIYIAGVLGMLGGLALVNAHNEWKAGWPVIITLIGWLALLGGIFRILVPQEAALIGTSMY